MLKAPIPAGTWQIVGDGAALSPATVRFSILWRAVGATTAQTMLSFQHDFTPNPQSELASVAYDDSTTAPAFGAPGDLIDLQIEIIANDAGSGGEFVPNGDPKSLGGQFLHLTLPQ